ncbi:MAG: diaminopimelate decarboxylase [Rikenellaceae bacterium]|nr:diaminopimelate decarboxylase [Rikenellaceae bacterium]MCL2691922.1 diaminopimelate decarboxylase [Rikenellaceae bacterium]
MLSSTIKERLDGLRTPFYLYDMGLLERTLEQVTRHSSRYGYAVHYALKANFEPRIFEYVRRFGLGVDCVSGNEVRYAIESGFPPSGIVYAGVGKSDAEMEYGLRHDIFAFNCESRQEVGVLNGIAARMGKVANVALRINPDVDPESHRYISTGQADSKFGISYREISELTAELGEMRNVRVSGLHFHIGSQIRNMAVFAKLCRRVNTLYEWFAAAGFSLGHINVGGGLGVNYEDPETEPIPDFATYFGTFHKNLRVGDCRVHFELGRSIVGQCGELVSRVLFTKTTAGGRNVAILDTSMTDLVRPALYQARHSIENLDGAGRAAREYIIAGTACETSDIFRDEVTLPELRRGDLVAIKSTGAYGSVMASRYNMHDIAPAVFSDTLVRASLRGL